MLKINNSNKNNNFHNGMKYISIQKMIWYDV